MRVEPFTIGDYVHVYNKGNRKIKIARDEKDKWRFMQAIRFFNDIEVSQNILRDILKPANKQNSNALESVDSVFKTGWPKNWPKKKPLVKILCYCLLSNHFHLLLKEISEGGISKFMQKLGIGYTKYFNIRYKEVGRLFQSSYHGKKIGDDQIYLEYLSVYIQVINVLKLFPGGINKALENINESLKFVEKYSFSSYQDFLGIRNSLIIDKDILGDIFQTPKEYKKFVYNILKEKKYEILNDLKME